MDVSVGSIQIHTDIVRKEWRMIQSLLNGAIQGVDLDGMHLCLADVVAISRYRISLNLEPHAFENLSRSLHPLRSRLANGEVIYGVNTGYGGSADVRTKHTQVLQRVLMRELHYGILAAASRDPKYLSYKRNVTNRFELSREQSPEAVHLPETWTRAAILIRLNSLVKGYSAVRPETVTRIADLLSNNIIPIIPLRGSISASGDLSPLSYIGGAIQGNPTIRVHSVSGDQYADVAFARAGLTPVTLEAKEGLAIVNGTAVSCAAAALALHDTHVLAVLSQIITSMSVEALNGTVESFDSFFSESRPHPGQIDAAKNIRCFLNGSRLVQVNDGAGNRLRQDRYATRTSPQWIGPVLEDLVLAHQQLSIEMNSATDNPLIDPTGRILNGGNFQAKAVTSAMEKARQGIQSLGRMLFCQCTEIINPATSFGLPPNLVAEDPSTSFIFKGIDICVAALQSELGFLANTVNHVQTAEMGNQSLNSLALISARYTHTSNDVLSQMSAAHLIALCQALDLRAMQAQFFESFQPELADILNTEYFAEAKVILATDKKIAESQLYKLLWEELQAAFSTTVSMDAQDRFPKIAQTLKASLLSEAVTAQVLNPLEIVQAFSESLARRLGESWCTFRNAYMLHGDASPLLGKASKKIYQFVRHQLGIPFLHSSKITTPKAEFGAEFDGKAPTVGTYNSIMYRAIRDGSIIEIIMDILEETKEEDDVPESLPK